MEYTINTNERPLFAEDFPIFEFPIYPKGDEAGLRTKNDPNDPYQRQSIIQRRGRVDIRCEHKDVAHGYLSKDSDDLSTLIVIQFRFDPNGIAARIKEAHATIKFAAMKKGSPDPEVIDMYPNGGFFVAPTVQDENITRTVGATMGAKAGGLEIRGQLKHQKTVNRNAQNFTFVRGSIDVMRASGKPNAVRWDSIENPTTKTGVVWSLQGAILLKRETMEPFKAIVSLDVSVDTISSIDALFTKDREEDDVWYDPNKPPTNRLLNYDVDNLSSVDLGSLSDVTFRTVLEGAIKQR
ncbi:hypothetical protein N7462_006133 [Penicillium macrosclerotiorum]|uniref:uncharacterized protein n=1 Tax=Penicillium macrosclerotiorum TaxID=303699 RepID=UPI0025465997|nr:uncharacterized protein N7462_006133 [Penicillium macrosclerotiorum]KAJ5682968.1 hypothetical protein N7462_006133 [Penicillium macrosclerotiorum]